jgi:hypothetical protein
MRVEELQPYLIKQYRELEMSIEGGPVTPDTEVVRILPYRGHKRVSGTAKRMAEAADTPDILEKRWEGVRTRWENLMKFGIHREQAYQWANTRKGYRRIAGSFLNTAITSHYLEAQGFPNLVNRYEELWARTQRLQMLHATH